MTASAPARRFPVFAVGTLAAALALLVFLTLGFNRPPSLPDSALGFRGLEGWLRSNEVQTRNFMGGGPLAPDGIGLRILPLYDSDLDAYNIPQLFETDRYLATDLAFMPRDTVTEKVRTLPTLVILPKWRDGVRLTGLTHPDFLIHRPDQEPARTEDQIEGSPVEIVDATDTPVPDEPAGTDEADEAADQKPRFVFREPDPVAPEAPGPTRIDLPSHWAGTAELRHVQWGEPLASCDTLIGDETRVLLVECPHPDGRYWVLTDPDLLNNHGLANGDNAAFALAFLTDIAAGEDILFDYSNIAALSMDPDEHERTWRDLLRFAEPPFAWIWLAAFILLATVLWRGGLRGVPLRSPFRDGHDGTREAALAAHARLMRSARADGALLRTLARSRAVALCDLLLGHDRQQADRSDRMLRALRQKNPKTAEALKSALARAQSLPDAIGLDEAVSVLDQLETAYEKARKLA